MAWTVHRMISTKRTAVGALALALTLGSHEARAQQKAPQRDAAALKAKRAADLVSQGKAAFAAGDMHEALRAYREAWEVTKTSQIAANLGTIEGNFGQHRAAAEHLWFAFSHISAAATDSQRQAISAALQAEKRHVVTLLVHGAPTGALISINEKAIGTLPVVDEIYVDPGQHRARVESPKYEGETRTFSALGGETVDLTFNLMPIVQAPVTPATPLAVQAQSVPPHADSSNKPSLAVVALGGGIALLGIATGMVFLVEANGASRDAQSAKDVLPKVPNPCGAGTPYVYDCKALRDANVAFYRDRNIAATGFAIAGAATIGTLIYAVWPRRPSESAFKAMPTLSPSYAGVQARWSW